MGKSGSFRRSVAGVVAITAAVGVALVTSSLAGASKLDVQQVATGTIIVEKQLIPDGYQPPQGGFVFSGAIDAKLGDGESASKEVDPGTYTVTESLEGRGFWDLISLVCTEDKGQDSSGDIPSLTATYKVEAGETVKCVFTNQKRGLIIVKKQTIPAGAQQSFPFTASWDASFSLADGGAYQSPALKPGNYSVSESVPAGWQQQSATCDNGDKPSSINLPTDKLITCTFVNVELKNLTPTVLTTVHDAQHNVVDNAPIGASVHDRAVVSGSGPTPTGTVSFRVHMGSLNCAGDGTAAGTVPLDASGVAHPSDSVTVPAGGLSFSSHYSGDNVYAPGDGACESLSASRPTATVLTTVHDAQHNVVDNAPIGASVHDRAVVSGSGPTPTGTVSFQVHMGSLNCAGEGSAAGTVPLDASGVAHPSDSVTVPAGGLSFSSHYSGDNVYLGVDGPCESLSASKLTPSVVTDVHNTSHAVISNALVGSSVHDRAVVSGSGPTPTGSVAFRVYLGSLQCAGDGQSAGTVPLDASGVAHPSDSVIVPAGGLSFRGHYSGDSVYSAADGPCETLGALPVTTGKGAIDVQKSATPTSLKEPGGPVTFSVTITNTSNVNVTVTNVVDDKFGDLDDDGGNGCFDVPINLAPGAHASCQFVGQVTGVGGTEHVDTVTASGTDEFGNPVTDTGSAKVVITPRVIDLVVVKDASSPTPLNGTVHYSLSVTNKGPDTATNVQLADPAPAGITYLTANPSQGTCNVSPALVTCDLGTIAAGQTVTIAITGKATTVGSHTNTATVTGSGGREANPADNTDSAVTQVPAPLKPPTVNPKPKPQPAYCIAVTVKPAMIKADGKTDSVKVKVMAGPKPAKGAKVIVSGGGVTKTGRANAKGIAVVKINPKKAGIVTVSVAESNHKLCGATARIGVIGVFLPPLTG